MSKTAWSNIHSNYKDQDWINKPSIFAEEAINYFPKSGKVLELGAGQAQDGCFFASKGYEVTATDIEESALELAKKKVTNLGLDVELKSVDLAEEMPFDSQTFDVVYAHLSLHYFDTETTKRLFSEIHRILKPGGVFAFLVNSVNDPEYKSGPEIEPDYFQIEDMPKRYFSETSARNFAYLFDINIADEMGETYKDSAKGIHGLVRFVGKRTLIDRPFKTALPYVSGIIERENDGVKEILLQTRWQPNWDPLYSGTLEFPAGVLDIPYENVFDALEREIEEETGLVLKSVIGESKTKRYNAQGSDESFAFRPFCCTQQLKDGKPWIGFVFICSVEDGDPTSQLSENRDVKWVPVEEVKEMFIHTPDKLFGLELPAWEYYFNEK